MIVKFTEIGQINNQNINAIRCKHIMKKKIVKIVIINEFVKLLLK